MRSNSVILLCLTVLFCLSCGKDSPSGNHVPEADFQASFIQVAADDACYMEWSGNDELKAWYRDGMWSLYYPLTKLLGSDPEWVGVQIPSVQRAVKDSCLLREYGFWTANSDGKSKEVALKPGFAVLKLIIDASGTPISDKSLTALKISANGVLSGNAIMDIPADSLVIAASGSKLTLQVADSIQFNEILTLYALVWPGLCNGMQIDVPCTQKYHLGMRLSEDIAFKAGECRTIELDIAQMLADGNADIDVERTDLSASATANCYVISGSGYYKFKATRGNSSVVPAGLSKVDWLWKDTNDDLLDDIELGEDAYISFWAGALKGNAVLAGFNAAGEIVWSWHLWFTDDPAEHFGYGVNANYRLLDRNLGATCSKPDSIASYGLYYQWGRKDPVIGSSILGYSTATKRIEQPGFSSATAAYYVNPSYPDHRFSVVENTTMPSGGEINYLVKNPMLFVTGDTWFANTANLTANKSLWGWDGGNGYTKSIYDPCPPGWKVPANAGGVELSDLNFALYDAGSSVLATVYSGANGSKIFFPPTGSRDNAGGYITYAGWTGRYWGALYRERTTDCWALSIDGDAFNPRQVHIASSFGASIRCVNE